VVAVFPIILSGLFCIVVGLQQTVAEAAPALFGGAGVMRQNKKRHWRAIAGYPGVNPSTIRAWWYWMARPMVTIARR